MAVFEVTGGHELKGELIPQGAKNEALQVIAATLLTKEPVTIHGIPEIQDVQLTIDLLEGLGVRVERLKKGSCRFTADNIDLEHLNSSDFQEKSTRLRGSVLLIGPLLARFGQGFIPEPGGDKIGRRRVDVHFEGFEKLGATFDYDRSRRTYVIDGQGMKGNYIHLFEPSVTGTANLIMTATLTPGRTTLYNAACEPYIQQLCHLLTSMGARIEGIGSNYLRIDGVDNLGGGEHELLPDMIEVGSFIGLAAMTASDLTIKKAGVDHLGIIPDIFRRLGIDLEIEGEDIHVKGRSPYTVESFIDGSILTIADGPWPNFTPDLLSVVMVVATQASGSVLIHQKMFESRLFFTDKLIDMGARIILCDPHRATVIGLERKAPLRGIEMTSPDIRAGVSLLIAALSAKGKSRIHNIDQIDRGYERIDERLKNLGAKIERIEEER